MFACFKRPISKENLSEAINEIRLQKYMDENHQNFGTRLQVYEGGRNALIPEIIAEYRGYDREIADRVIDQIESNSDYIPEPGSEEAINFAKFQDHMLRIGIFKDPIIAPNYLVGDSDLDGDKISDFDKDGDNLLDFSSEIGLGERIIDFFKNIFERKIAHI